jgi:hypothetical protein
MGWRGRSAWRRSGGGRFRWGGGGLGGSLVARGGGEGGATSKRDEKHGTGGESDRWRVATHFKGGGGDTTEGVRVIRVTHGGARGGGP